MRSKYDYLHQIYINKKKNIKKIEQLEIGKIKFNVVPIYFNNQIIHTLFTLNFTPNKFTQTVKKNNYKLFIYIILTLISLYAIYFFIAHICILYGFCDTTSSTLREVIVPTLLKNLNPSVCNAVTKSSIGARITSNLI